MQHSMYYKPGITAGQIKLVKFDYFRTHKLYVSRRTPQYLYIKDTGRGQNCARVLYCNQVQDFVLGPGNFLNMLSLGWWGGGGDPIHMTVVPFNSNSNYLPVNNIKVGQSLAVWLLVYKGQSTDHNNKACTATCLSTPRTVLVSCTRTWKGLTLVQNLSTMGLSWMS